MTVETTTPVARYPISSIGPYGIEWPYFEDSHMATLEVDGVQIPVDAAFFSISPTSSLTGGNLFLDYDFALANAGRQLIVQRTTVAEQGWQGTQGERETGLERQLDRLTMQAQETAEALLGSLRVLGRAVPPVLLADDQTIIWKDGAFQAGPTGTEISNAQANSEAAKDAAEAAKNSADLVLSIAAGYIPITPKSPIISDGTLTGVVVSGVYTSPKQIMIWIGGSRQAPENGFYTVAPDVLTTTVTFAEAIPAGLQVSYEAKRQIATPVADPLAIIYPDGSTGIDLWRGATPFASLAAFLAANIPAPIKQAAWIESGRIYEATRDAAGPMTTADGSKWRPSAATVDLRAMGGDPVAAKDFVAAQNNKRAIMIEGTVTHAQPVNYNASRSDSWKGTTGISNVVQPGSSIRYTGSGKTQTSTSATAANPAVFTKTAHGFVGGEEVWASAVTGGTWQAALSGGPWKIVYVSADTFTLTNRTGAAAFSGVGLGTLTSVTFKNNGAIAAFNLIGSFGQQFEGLVMRASGGSDAIVRIGANDVVGGTDFSGSITAFKGVQFIPQVNPVTDALVTVQNHKFATFEECWFAAGLGNYSGLRLGKDREKTRRTLMVGVAAYTVLDRSFMFSDIAIENAEGTAIRSCQFDATTDPVRVKGSGKGVAARVLIETSDFTNDGGGTGTGLPAIEQMAANQSDSFTLPYTGGWAIQACQVRDWPIGAYLGAGMARVSANQFRGRVAGNIGLVIGENARGEVIDASNDFSQMYAVGNVGIEDRRYKTVAITGATQANPVVVDITGHHLANGDRIRIENVAGMVELNNREFLVQGCTTNTAQLYSVTDNGATSATVDGTAYTAYTSGGTVRRPYMWHRENIGGTLFSVGHSDMVFDLALDQNAIQSASVINVLNMTNVPIIGGHYEITYGSVIDMNSVTGRVKFEVSIDGVSYGLSSLERNVVTTDEVHHFFQRRIHIPSATGAYGSTVRFRCTGPGAVMLRGKVSGSFGGTFCQIRRVA